MLSVAVAQPESILHDVAFNARCHATAILSARARVVVFPELSLTGYAMNVQPVDLGDPNLDPIIAACREANTIALVGAPTKDAAGGVHISTLRVDAGQASLAYDKMWLGEEESAFFVQGRQPNVVVVNGWRLGLAICKDTGVADHAAATVGLGIDAYVAGVCETEEDHEVQAGRAARVVRDHGVWVAVASFAGPTGGGFDRTAGRSAIWGPDGTKIAEADREPGTLVRADLSRGCRSPPVA